MTLWWVRHGPTHCREMIGWTDAPADLSDSPRLARLARYLPAEAVVVSSDLCRAVATADAIQGSRRRLPHDPALREINFGAWEARSFAEIDAEDPDLCRQYFSTPGSVAPPDGESWDALAARTSKAADRLLRLVPSAPHVIAVAHFGPILTQIRRARGCSAEAALAQKIDPLSVTCLHWDGTAWQERAVNHHP